MNSFFRIEAAVVAAMIVLTLAGAAIPAQAQTPTTLYDFPGGNTGFSDPQAWATAQGRDGNLYSTSVSGGTLGYGTLFQATPSGTVNIFASIGYFVISGATLGTDGSFYGTNQDGGAGGNCGFAGCGQVYKVTPAGVETILHSFTNTGDGSDPHSAPIEDTNGTFYGTTPTENNGSNSTVYTITPSGTFTTIHTFTGADGQNVTAPLVQGTNGDFYGDTVVGGTSNDGVIFKMTPSGAVTVLHSFAGTDGSAAYYALIQANDGNFYGTTYTGGSIGNGVVFKITPGGDYSVVHNLNLSNGDGDGPSSSLIQGSNGLLYGVTGSVNSGNYGTIYSVDITTGVFTTLYSFAGTTDGDNPQSPLRQHTNGLLYGFTVSGGDLSECSGHGCGVFFSLDVGAPAFASLVSTSGKEGAHIGILGQGFSSSSVVEFDGVTASFTRQGTTFISATVPAGALTGEVTVTTGATTLTSNDTFRVTPTFASFNPPSGPVGTPVVLTGTGLTQTTKVTFGGVAATTFTVNSDTQVTADVPTRAVTGKIEITTKGGHVSSTSSFTVN
jgi:uncharacterized repeat protein (TIGR03803 family)